MTTDSHLPDHSAAYRGVRERIIDLVRSEPPERQMMVAPATPDWRVHDVVAHLAGATSDVLAGRLEGVGSDPWTAKQVEDRHDVLTEVVLDEWDTNSVQIDPMVPTFGPASGQIVLDAVTHEHDIRDDLHPPHRGLHRLSQAVAARTSRAASRSVSNTHTRNPSTSA
ncbi:MAG: hypothetical protein ABJC79_12805 [Acidimicrobiia bacterium]